MRHRFLTLASFLAVLALVGSLPDAANAGVINGQFEEGTGDNFVGWSTLPPLPGLPPEFNFNSPTEGTDSGRFVVFEDEDLGSQLEQLVTIPSNPDFLSFDFWLVTNEPSASGTNPDAFQATLFDDTFSGVLPSGDPIDQPAFFSIDDRLDTLSNPAVTTTTSGPGLRSDWTRVRLDISSLAPRSLLLEFVLLNGTDTSTDSSAFLDNVVIASKSNVIPEPTSWAVFFFLTALLCGTRRIGESFRRPAGSAA